MNRNDLSPFVGRGLLRLSDSNNTKLSAGYPSKNVGVFSMDYNDQNISTDINRSSVLEQSYNSVDKRRFLMESQQDINLSRITDINESSTLEEKSNMLHTQFLEILQSRTNETEMFDTIQDFIQICSGVLEEVTKEQTKFTHRKKIEDMLWLEQENNTWKLLHCLYKDRIMNQKDDADCEIPTLSASEKEIVNALYSTNAVLREYQLIVDWLEACAKNQTIQVPHFTDRKIGWENSLLQLQCPESVKFVGTQDIVKSLDPDAPCREKKLLHPLDMEDEERLVKHIFQMIRQGRIEDAKALCEYCGQPWRAAILEGWRLYEDPNYEFSNDIEKKPIEGNPRRDIWKKLAWMMADNKKFDDYTRAIVGVFCGHLESLLAVSGESWEDLLWAYLKVQIDIRVESEIRSCCTKSYISMPEKYENNKMSLKQIFEEITFHKELNIQEAAKSPMNIIQKHLIMDKVSELLQYIQNWIQKKNLSSQMLRFLTHIILFMRQLGRIDREEIADEVIKTYVECLIETGDAQLIAFYTSELAGDLQIQMYSKFLQTLKETDKRKFALEEAVKAGLDVQSITSHAVETIRNRQRIEEDFQLKGDTSPFDEEKISALELLTFYSEQIGELLWQANAMIRQFLTYSEIENIRKVMKMIPNDSISQIVEIYGNKDNLPRKEECSVKEYLCHQTYLAAIDGFNDWNTLYHNRPKEPEILNLNSNFTEKIASEHKQKAYEVELERWRSHLQEQTRITKDLLFNILLFPDKGWLIDPDTTKKLNDIEMHTWENRVLQMNGLRKICIPEVVLILHKVLHLTGNYRECVRLADEIASEYRELYKVYSKHKLSELLSKIAESSLALMNEKFDPWGYTITS